MKIVLFFVMFLINSFFYSQIGQQQIAIAPPQSDPTLVVFGYDLAGNQIYRGPAGDICANCKNTENTILSLTDQIANKIQAAPVPVKTDLTVIWDASIHDYITKIELLPYNAFTILQSTNISSNSSNSYIFPMSSYAYGVYYLKFYLTDGSIYTKTVTKN